MIHTIPSPLLPIIIPIGLAIGGFSLIGYHFWSRNKREKLIDIIQKEQKQKEIEQLEKGESSKPQRQKENEDRFTPSNVK